MNPAQPYSCIVQCPQDKGFRFEMINGKPACAYETDLQYFVPITPLPSINTPEGQPVPTAAEIPTFKAELDTFNKNFPPVLAQVDRKRQLDDAYKAMQIAENSADESPDAYQDARVRYYTLLKGDTWKEEEGKRVGKAEAEPVVQSYVQRLNAIQEQNQKQTQTMDVIKGVQDKVLSVKDDLKYSVDTFQKQIRDLQNEILVERHKSTESSNTMWTFFDLGLNILLFFLLLALIVVAYRKLFAESETPAAPTAPALPWWMFRR
jgi:hypothetical protein